ncbi:MAG: hypothetical protein ABI696_18500 [Rubrivivax sp.]
MAALHARTHSLRLPLSSSFRLAADPAVACPLLEGIDLSGARWVRVLIAASKGTFRRVEPIHGREQPARSPPMAAHPWRSWPSLCRNETSGRP